jgi:hypothetical protein
VHSKTEAGKQKSKGSDKVDAETGDLEKERSGWADRKGGGREVMRKCVDFSTTEEQISRRSCVDDEGDWGEGRRQ